MILRFKDEQVTRKLENSLKAFNTTYLDLFLLHYPRSFFSIAQSWFS